MTYTNLTSCMATIDNVGKVVCPDFRNINSEYTYGEIKALEDIFVKVITATNYALTFAINVRINFVKDLLCDAVQVISSYLDDLIPCINVLKYEFTSNSVTIYTNFSQDYTSW